MARRQDALDYHQRRPQGKLEVVPTKPLVTQLDLSLAYTPGVAEPCREIAADEDKSWDYTARGNLVAVVSNGTAVLGLGDIGPAAGKPVMEGKACLFKKFADIDVFDLEISETDVDRVVDLVAALEPTFGGINLEDIAAPACFEIERKLRERMRIPVFHDDQHGTAIISGAALLNACEVAGKDIGALRIVVSGAGAAAIACLEFFLSLGARRENVVLVDSRGVIYEGRENLNEHKRRFAGPDTGARTLADAMSGADMFMGVSVGGLVTAEMVQSMAERPIIFALANPDPEIPYPDARAAREDAIVATGRSDYPNQVNNVLGFPYIFRGALDVRATSISEDMKIAAAKALAKLAREPVPDSVISAYGGQTFKFGPEYLIPKPFDSRVLWWVAPAVAEAAIASGVARREIDVNDYREHLARRSGNAAYSILRTVIRAAKHAPKRIVFPEANSPKILRAVQTIVDEGLARPVLLGERAPIEAYCKSHDLDFLDHGVEIIDPMHADNLDEYAARLWELRQRKGMTRGLARSLACKRNYYGMLMVRAGEADGLVGGLTLTYPETLRPALQVLGLLPGVKVATSMYMMLIKDRVMFFADPTINIDPTAEVLADIATQVSDAVSAMGIHPRVAMVSFSNFGSVEHPAADKAVHALRLVREQRPDLEIEGELQIDYAVDKSKLDEHFPFARLGDDANVLIFPNLTAANVAYRVLAALGGAQAVGPILLGIGKPVALLQNESTVDDIVTMTAHTVLMVQRYADIALSEAGAASP
ncbi:NADP-dependent malic enzyme [Haliangium ochraceum]|uniref:Malate dehydrogenase (Oxaloacetate-decarboxylating) (NADP(+))., Phosphate acetyltransferase n=1 Tax=Haliangium ochraceum (strain DSM 14365 / JCM 11303 / SMP-2) TaxID=502025 RepID=D0LKZ4_HALO1|nr:NADP-dependent malic enzyme [Haliangium ochraceum]ACY16714.1 Malate dehydrogenase (oxaloacetate- decarboxylating) (NADP(+))., Phosphate acetyltransferase [Haliangium ochraceum DSM 14365]